MQASLLTLIADKAPIYLFNRSGLFSQSHFSISEFFSETHFRPDRSLKYNRQYSVGLPVSHSQSFCRQTKKSKKETFAAMAKGPVCHACHRTKTEFFTK